MPSGPAYLTQPLIHFIITQRPAHDALNVWTTKAVNAVERVLGTVEHVAVGEC